MNRLVGLLITIFSCAHCTNVVFKNSCGGPVTVIKTENNRQPVSECQLGPGASCTKSYSSNGMNFKNGLGGKTLAEFSFNSWNNQDFYDLSVIVGYDTAMQIRTDAGGPTVTCTSPKCPDAYLFPKDDTKTHGCPTGHTFTVTFCP